MAGLFELFVDAQSQFRFRLLDAKGVEMAVSSAFEDKSAAVAGIEAVRERRHGPDQRLPRPVPCQATEAGETRPPSDNHAPHPGPAGFLTTGVGGGPSRTMEQYPALAV